MPSPDDQNMRHASISFLTFTPAFIESLTGSVQTRASENVKISLEWLSEYAPGALREIGGERAARALMNGGLPVESIEPHGDGVVLDVEVTSNRSDCLSHVGVARELAALLDRPFADVKI